MHPALDSNSGKNMIGNSTRDMRTSLWYCDQVVPTQRSLPRFDRGRADDTQGRGSRAHPRGGCNAHGDSAHDVRRAHRTNGCNLSVAAPHGAALAVVTDITGIAQAEPARRHKSPGGRVGSPRIADIRIPSLTWRATPETSCCSGIGVVRACSATTLQASSHTGAPDAPFSVS